MVRAFSYTTGHATAALKTLYHQRNADVPLTNIHIDTMLTLTAHTMEVRWLEKNRNPKSGEVLNQNHYTASLNYRFGKVADDTVIADQNPFGFYITGFVLAQERKSMEENT